MRLPKIMIGSGWYCPPGNTEHIQFARLWMDHLHRQYPNIEVRIISVGNSPQPCAPPSPRFQTVELSGNLGHVHHLIHGIKPFRFGGWSVTMLTLALLAYQNESDLVFLEQDALAFGPWIEQMYEEIGDARCLFGSIKLMPCAQSLFLVRHNFLTDFVRMYLALGADRAGNLPEHKFVSLEKENPELFKRFSFGFDRDRPLDYDAKVWYGQQFTGEELAIIKGKGLL